MQEHWPETRKTLLVRLRNLSDQSAWEEFVEIYEPLVVRVAIRQGLQYEDAREIAQKVLIVVVESIEQLAAFPEKTRLRSWLATVARNAAINAILREKKHRGSGRSSVAEQLNQIEAGNGDIENTWQQEHRMQLFRAAAEIVRKRCTEDAWAIFWRTTIEEEPIEEVSREYGKSIGAAYAARSRILASIRKVVQERWSELEE